MGGLQASLAEYQEDVSPDPNVPRRTMETFQLAVTHWHQGTEYQDENEAHIIITNDLVQEFMRNGVSTRGIAQLETLLLMEELGRLAAGEADEDTK